MIFLYYNFSYHNIVYDPAAIPIPEIEYYMDSKHHFTIIILDSQY
jgi:hypothetical protein